MLCVWCVLCSVCCRVVCVVMLCVVMLCCVVCCCVVCVALYRVVRCCVVFCLLLCIVMYCVVSYHVELKVVCFLFCGYRIIFIVIVQDNEILFGAVLLQLHSSINKINKE